MKIIDNFDIYFDNHIEFEKFMNTSCNESFDDLYDINYLFSELYGLESNDKGKMGRLLDALKTIWKWILNKLKSKWNRLGKMKTEINALLSLDYSKYNGVTVKGLVDPGVLNSLSKYYELVITTLSEILREFKLGELNFDKVEKFVKNINEHNQNIANIKKPPLDKEINASDIKKYLTELSKAVQLLREERKEVTSLVFEIYNAVGKLSSDNTDISLEYIKNIKNYLNNIFEPMDLYEEAIVDSIKVLSNVDKKDDSSTESVDSKIIAAVMEEYGIEGVANIIKSLASK